MTERIRNKTMMKRITALILCIVMTLSLSTICVTAGTSTPTDLDLSFLSLENANKTEDKGSYSYSWTVETKNYDTVRKLVLTLDGASIKTLTLPCISSGELHITINTVGDSYVEKVMESHVFNYSKQWDTITFGGTGALEISYLSIQGGDNDHMITVSKGASLKLTGDYTAMSFGSSGSNNSTLNVYGKLSVKGTVGCGHVEIGSEGELSCEILNVSGTGCFDTDEEKNAFVLKEGGRLEIIGYTYMIDDATGEQYAALSVNAPNLSVALDEVIVIPENYLPEGYSIKNVDNYVVVDNADTKLPEGTLAIHGIIYAATSLSIPQNTHTVSFDSVGGSAVSSTTVTHGEKLTRPTDPTKDGYTFKGWYNVDLSVEYDFDKAVSDSFTLYAKWQKNSSNTTVALFYHTVKFDSNGGSYVPNKYVTRFIKLREPRKPIKDNCVFEGWYTDKELEEPYDFDSRVTDSFTLYAKWRKATVSDILNTNEHFAYIKGYEDNTVRPEANLTRAEAVEIFFRLLDKNTRDVNLSQVNDFVDAKPYAWYNVSLSTMAKLGIVNGRENGFFAPDEYITRGEFAAICARFDHSDYKVEETFSDVKGHWAEDEIYEASAHGWIGGYPDGTFKPQGLITRAEAITMINRMLGRTPTSPSDLHVNMKKWSDNPENAWYYIAVQEATNTHSYVKSNGEKWTEVNE